MQYVHQFSLPILSFFFNACVSWLTILLQALELRIYVIAIMKTIPYIFFSWLLVIFLECLTICNGLWMVVQALHKCFNTSIQNSQVFCSQVQRCIKVYHTSKFVQNVHAHISNTYICIMHTCYECQTAQTCNVWYIYHYRVMQYVYITYSRL